MHQRPNRNSDPTQKLCLCFQALDLLPKLTEIGERMSKAIVLATDIDTVKIDGSGVSGAMKGPSYFHGFPLWSSLVTKEVVGWFSILVGKSGHIVISSTSWIPSHSASV